MEKESNRPRNDNSRDLKDENPQRFKKEVIENSVQGAGARYPGQDRPLPNSEAGGDDGHMGAEESDRPGGIAPQEARKSNYTVASPAKETK